MHIWTIKKSATVGVSAKFKTCVVASFNLMLQEHNYLEFVIASNFNFPLNPRSTLTHQQQFHGFEEEPDPVLPSQQVVV
jgi:hypothetical protein